MATNPMQKKARNSFILGVLITFIIMALIVAYLFLQMKKLQDEQAKMTANYVKVCVLKSDVVSGQILTSDLVTTKDVDKNTVPSNGTQNITNLTNYFLEDKSGNPVITNNGKNIELQTEDATGEYYIEDNGNKEYIELTTPPLIAKIDMKANTVLTSSMIAKSDEKTTDGLRIQE